MESPPRMEKFSSSTIDQYAEGSVTNATHYPVDKGMRKSRVDEDEVKVTPVNLVKWFSEINLENSRFQSERFDRVKGLLGSTNGLMNLPMIQKCKLFLFNVRG